MKNFLYLLETKASPHTQECVDSHHMNGHFFNLEKKIRQRQRRKWGCSWLLQSCALGCNSTCRWLLVHEVEEAHVSLHGFQPGASLMLAILL